MGLVFLFVSVSEGLVYGGVNRTIERNSSNNEITQDKKTIIDTRYF
jgi:hypothetical protein